MRVASHPPADQAELNEQETLRAGRACWPALVRVLLLTLGCALATGYLVLWLTSAAALGQEGAATPVPADGATTLTDTAALTDTAVLTETAEITGAVAEGPRTRPDSACRMCHANSTRSLTLPSGEVINAGIDLAVLEDSMHGIHASQDAADVYCTDCHQPRQRYLYPHEPTPAQTLHDFSSEISANCESCHVSAELHNPGHLQALRSGADPATLPTCTDCHGGHDVGSSEALVTDGTAFCQSCHAVADMEDPALKAAHENVMQSFGAQPAEGDMQSTLFPIENSCRTCHTDQQQAVSQQCVNCHRMLSGAVERGDESIELNVDAHDVLSSVHGRRVIDGQIFPALQCADCHRDMADAGFPHPEELLVDRAQLRLNVEAACTDCHEGAAEESADGIHATRIAEGELNAASCADCHGSHNIQLPNVPRTRISDTCGDCHTEVFDTFKTSVHGSALYGRDNPDVPVCTDCHGAHNIDDPTTAAFRQASPQMCGECHANEVMMEKYDISTAVFDTYVADFHGTTVTLFNHENPNEPVNAAVCYDCHGVHDIQSVSEATEDQIQQRLLENCRQCHPNASENFPAAWLSHYVPSLEHYPAVYLVDLFYKVLIPTVLAGFMLFIFSDIFRRLSDRWLARRKAKAGAGRGTDQS